MCLNKNANILFFIPRTFAYIVLFSKEEAVRLGLKATVYTEKGLSLLSTSINTDPLQTIGRMDSNNERGGFHFTQSLARDSRNTDHLETKGRMDRNNERMNFHFTR